MGPRRVSQIVVIGFCEGEEEEEEGEGEKMSWSSRMNDRRNRMERHCVVSSIITGLIYALERFCNRSGWVESDLENCVDRSRMARIGLSLDKTVGPGLTKAPSLALPSTA